MNTANTPKLPKLTARKWNGDDQYSWAVWIDGRQFANGLARTQVRYYKRMALQIWCEKNGVDYSAALIKAKLA